MDAWTPFIWFAVCGIASGFLSGLLSIGGALVLVPALLLVFSSCFHFPTEVLVQMTLGTTMSCMIANAFSSSYSHHRRLCVCWDYLKAHIVWICLGTVTGVLLTSLFSPSLIKLSFAAFCLYCGYKMMLRGVEKLPLARSSSAKYPAFMFASVSGFIGVGGATLFVPYLSKYKGFDLKLAMGTAAGLQIPIALIGTSAYLLMGCWGHERASVEGALGYVYLPAFLIISLSGICFNYLGVRVAHRLPVAKLKLLFGVFTFLIGLNMGVNTLIKY